MLSHRKITRFEIRTYHTSADFYFFEVFKIVTYIEIQKLRPTEMACHFGNSPHRPHTIEGIHNFMGAMMKV